jgi:hypothetical protein
MTFSRALQNYEERIIFVYKSFQYKPFAPRINTPIDLGDLKSHLRIDWNDDTHDNYLSLLIGSVVDRAEKYMNISLINQQWITYRDMFDGAFELRRAPFVTLDSFQYITVNSPTPIPVPLIYQIVDDYPYCILTPTIYNQWPSDISDAYHSIIIKFTTGYGVDKTTVPNDIKAALLEHAANVYANRGDSDVAGQSVSGTGTIASTNAIPRIALDIYDSYKRRTIDGAIFY